MQCEAAGVVWDISRSVFFLSWKCVTIFICGSWHELQLLPQTLYSQPSNRKHDTRESFFLFKYTRSGQNEMNLQHNTSWKKLYTSGECDLVLSCSEIPSSCVLLKMENAVCGLFSWVWTRWRMQPWLMVYAVLTLINLSDQLSPALTERAPVRPELLHHRMKDDYSELCCIYSWLFCPLRREPCGARKVLPHRFNVL